jgi:hypothetical protein
MRDRATRPIQVGRIANAHYDAAADGVTRGAGRRPADGSHNRWRRKAGRQCTRCRSCRNAWGPCWYRCKRCRSRSTSEYRSSRRTAPRCKQRFHPRVEQGNNYCRTTAGLHRKRTSCRCTWPPSGTGCHNCRSCVRRSARSPTGTRDPPRRSRTSCHCTCGRRCTPHSSRRSDHRRWRSSRSGWCTGACCRGRCCCTCRCCSSAANLSDRPDKGHSDRRKFSRRCR